jgi:hypothetical protein
MQRLLPALFILFVTLNACKKDKKSDAAVNEAGNVAPGIITVNSVKPATVTAGSIVTLSGRGFGSSIIGINVYFSGKLAVIASVTPTEIKAIVPVTTSGEITVTVADKTFKGPAFGYSDLGRIAGIYPATASAGATVKIFGSNFGVSGPVSVTFNGKKADVLNVSASEITVAVPETTSGHVVITSGEMVVQGPVFDVMGQTMISSITPTEGSSGTVVTITGSNFGSTPSGVQVFFNGKAGSVATVSPNQIKVNVPVTTTGNIWLTINGVTTNGPEFTYKSPMVTPYINGNVVLASQADVDAFVSQNKGKPLQINGSLSVSGNDITSTAGLSNITSVAQNLTVSGLTLNDVAFLNNITSVGGNIQISNLPATSIAMNSLSGSVRSVKVSSCKNLRSISFKLLNAITGDMYTGGLTLSTCEQLTDMDFSSLKTIGDELYISTCALQNFTKFSSLQSVGSMSIFNNSSLINFRGLEKLSTFTTAAITGSWGMSNSSSINGLLVSRNEKLTSLSGLENLVNLPLARIQQNAALTDFCPAKALLLRLSVAQPFTYRRQSQTGMNMYTTHSQPALTMTSNGSFSATSNAVDALALCK